jgi:hypothetical protein
MLAGNETVFCARIASVGPSPPFHFVGGLRSLLHSPSFPAALAPPWLAGMGCHGRNPAFALPADARRKLVSEPRRARRLSRWISAPLLGRASLPGRVARLTDPGCRHCLRIQSRRLRCAVPGPSRCWLVNRRCLWSSCPKIEYHSGPRTLASSYVA